MLSIGREASLSPFKPFTFAELFPVPKRGANLCTRMVRRRRSRSLEALWKQILVETARAALFCSYSCVAHLYFYGERCTSALIFQAMNGFWFESRRWIEEGAFMWQREEERDDTLSTGSKSLELSIVHWTKHTTTCKKKGWAGCETEEMCYRSVKVLFQSFPNRQSDKDVWNVAVPSGWRATFVWRWQPKSLCKDWSVHVHVHVRVHALAAYAVISSGKKKPVE